MCLEDEPGNKSFWAEVQKLGLPISLIRKDETNSKNGKRRAVSEARALEVRCFFQRYVVTSG